MTLSHTLVINFESLFNFVPMGFKVPLELGLAIDSALTEQMFSESLSGLSTILRHAKLQQTNNIAWI